MGTDIHIRVQKRDTDNGDWQTLLPPVKKYNYDGGPYYRSWYHERNYDVFAVLANVRNGYGFAGIYRGEPIEPISEPRDLPADVTDVDGTDYDNYVDPEGDSRVKYCRDSLGDHSFTWFMAWELLNATQWKQRQFKGGVVTPRQYKRWKDEGAPETWCGSIDGPGIVTVGDGKMEALIAQGVVDPNVDDAGNSRLDDRSCAGNDGNRYYARISWQQPGGVEESCSEFIDWMNNELRPIADKYGEGNVRVLIGFDS